MAKIKVKMDKELMTEKEFDALLKAYKLSNPKKYEAKVKSGEFDRKRAMLPKAVEAKKEEPKVEKK